MNPEIKKRISLLLAFVFLLSAFPFSGWIAAQTAVTAEAAVALPEITEQPQSVITEVGEKVVFSVTARGSGLTYQWEKLVDEEADLWQSLGASFRRRSFTVTVTAKHNGTQYRCKVTNDFGAFVYTDPAGIALSGKLSVTGQPASVAAQLGDRVVFRTTASGLGLSYQWEKLVNGAWQSLGANFAKPAFSIIVKNNHAGVLYRCKVTDGEQNVVYSDPAAVSVNGALVLAFSPASATAAIGDRVLMRASAAGVGVQYQWEKLVNGSWQSLGANYTKSSFAITVAKAHNGAQYRCVITDAAGASVITEPATINVSGLFAITRQPVSVEPAVGDKVTFSVEAVGTGLTYQWERLADAETEDWQSLGASYNKSSFSLTVAARHNGYSYRCRVMDATGAVLYSSPASILFTDVLAVTRQPSSVAAQIGDRVVFRTVASGTGLNYQWEKQVSGVWQSLGANFAKSAFSIIVSRNHAGVLYRCRITDASGESVYTEPVTVAVNGALLIVSQPASVETEAGQRVTFRVSAVGTGVQYQWEKLVNGVWQSLGASYTSSAFSITAAKAHNGMQYRCVLTDEAGQSVASQPAQIRILLPLAITAQPQSAQAGPNETVTFSVTATGNDLSYQWEQLINGTWESVGAAGTGAAFPVVVSAQTDGAQYRCVVTDGRGSTAVSEPAALQMVQPAGPVITTEPADVSAWLNFTATFTVEAQGEGDLTYSWYVSTNNGATWANMGKTEASLQTPATIARNNALFHCVIKDANGTAVTTRDARLTVATRITKQPADVNAEIGKPAVFSLTATGYELTYQWEQNRYFDDDDVWTPIAGAADTSLTLDADGELHRNRYRCVITDGNGVQTVSDTVTLNVLWPPVIALQPWDASAYLNYNATFTIEAQGEGDLTYSWYVSTDNGATWANMGKTEASLQTPATIARNNALFHCVVKDSRGLQTVTRDARLTVKTNVTAPPADAAVLAGEQAAFSVTATGYELTYRWERIVTAGESWAPIENANAATYSLTATDELNGSLYRCVITDGNGVQTHTDGVRLSVLHRPVIVTEPADNSAWLNYNASFTVEAQSGTDDETLTYLWYVSTDNGGKWTSMGTTTPTLSTPATVARNNALFHCVVKNADGLETVTRDARLTVATRITRQPTEMRAELGTDVSCSVTATGYQLVYRWEQSADEGENWTAIENAIENTYTFTAAEELNGNLYRCVITDGNGVQTPTDAVSLTVLYRPVIVTEPADNSAWLNYRADFTVEAQGDGLTYLWYVSTDNGGKWTSMGVTTATLSTNVTLARNNALFHCVVKNADGLETVTRDARLTVATRIVSQPVGLFLQDGREASFSVSATGYELSFSWEESADRGETWTALGVTDNICSFTATTAQNGNLYRCVITDGNDVQTFTNAAILTVLRPPEIVTEPADCSAWLNYNAAFTVEAQGEGLSYQWYVSTDNGGRWSSMGVTTPTLTTPATLARNNALFRCVVKNADGLQAVTRDARLTVATRIVTQPADLRAEAGTQAECGVSATGYALSYRWEQSADGGETWTALENAASSSFAVTAVQELNGRLYRCVITDGNGVETPTDAVCLTVLHRPVIVTEPADGSAWLNYSVTFTVAASSETEDETLTYTWYVSTDNGGSWINLGVASNPTLVTPAVPARNNALFRCVVKNSDGLEAVTRSARLRVTTRLLTQPDNRFCEQGETVQYAVSATGCGLSYAWETSTDQGGTWSPLESAAEEQLSVQLTTANNGALYRCVVTDANGLQTVSEPAFLYDYALYRQALSVVGFTSGTPIVSSGWGSSFFPRDRLLLGAYNVRNDDANAVLLAKDAKMDFFITSYPNEALLDLCEQTGLGVIGANYNESLPALNKNSFDADKMARWASYDGVTNYKSHAALWGDAVYDEPMISYFPSIATATSTYKLNSHGRIPFVNLLPSYPLDNAGDWQDKEVAKNLPFPDPEGENDLLRGFKGYISEYINTVDTDHISIDLYPYRWSTQNGGQVKVTNDLWLRRMDIVAEACKATNRDFWIIVQAAGSQEDGIRYCYTPEIMQQAYVSLAFGAKTIIYGCYQTGWWDDGSHMLTYEGAPTNTYYAVKTVNEGLSGISALYGGYTYRSTYLVNADKTVSPRSAQLATTVPSEKAQIVTENGLLVGTFDGADGTKGYVVTNAEELGNEVTATATFTVPNAVSVTVYQNGAPTVYTGDTAQLTLSPGEGVFIVCAFQ